MQKHMISYRIVSYRPLMKVDHTKMRIDFYCCLEVTRLEKERSKELSLPSLSLFFLSSSVSACSVWSSTPSHILQPPLLLLLPCTGNWGIKVGPVRDIDLSLSLFFSHVYYSSVPSLEECSRTRISFHDIMYLQRVSIESTEEIETYEQRRHLWRWHPWLTLWVVKELIESEPKSLEQV